MDQKIRTYMIIYDYENIQIGLKPVQSCFYEIEQFNPPTTRFNNHTFQLENNEISVIIKNPFLSKDVCDIFEKGRKLNIAIVKFWGNASQEFKYAGSFLSSVAFDGPDQFYHLNLTNVASLKKMLIRISILLNCLFL